MYNTVADGRIEDRIGRRVWKCGTAGRRLLGGRVDGYTRGFLFVSFLQIQVNIQIISNSNVEIRLEFEIRVGLWHEFRVRRQWRADQRSVQAVRPSSHCPLSTVRRPDAWLSGCPTSTRGSVKRWNAKWDGANGKAETRLGTRDGSRKRMTRSEEDGLG